MPRLEGPSGRQRWAHPDFCSQGVHSLIGEPDTHPTAMHPRKCYDGRCTGTKRVPSPLHGDTWARRHTWADSGAWGGSVPPEAPRGGWLWDFRKEAGQWAGPGNEGPAGKRSGFYPKALGSHRRLFSKRERTEHICPRKFHHSGCCGKDGK